VPVTVLRDELELTAGDDAQDLDISSAVLFSSLSLLRTFYDREWSTLDTVA